MAGHGIHKMIIRPLLIFMCYVALFLSYCQTLKIINMSNLREKAIEIAKQTSSESAFMCGYDRACQEYEEKNKWIKVKNDYFKTELQNDILIKFKCQVNLERIVVGHIFQGRFYLKFSDNMQPLKNVMSCRSCL